MRSDVEASHIEIFGAGDKGFSIGEMSHVKLVTPEFQLVRLVLQ